MLFLNSVTYTILCNYCIILESSIKARVKGIRAGRRVSKPYNGQANEKRNGMDIARDRDKKRGMSFIDDRGKRNLYTNGNIEAQCQNITQ